MNKFNENINNLMISGMNLNYFSGATNDLSFNTDGSAINPGAFQQHFRRDSNLMGQLFQVN
jgi:hypothetical protein